MSDSAGKKTVWHESRLNEHVARTIREAAGNNCTIDREKDGSLRASLRHGAEMAVWLAIRRSITEAGWRLTDE